jgi:pyrimidine operon attenuation protein/uracil phosphoribosyltransferase
LKPKLILDSRKISIITDRLCFELIENHNDFSNTALIGLQPRGVLFARNIHRRISEITGRKDMLYGELDITFYRDDFRKHDVSITAHTIKIDFLVEKKNVILVDDVLYTGRSVRAAMDALNDFGRPDKVELMVLIDRRYSRQLPIEPDYAGARVDTRANDKIRVEWTDRPETYGKVWLTTN